MLDTAAREGVSLKAKTKEVAPELIQPSEKIDTLAVYNLVCSMRKRGWCGPHLVVLEWEGPSGLELNLINGNHRLRAALLFGMPVVPVVLIDQKIDDFFCRYDIGRIEAEELLQEANPHISIRSSGKEKHRTSW